MAGPGLQQIGEPQRQVTHRNDEIAALASLNLPGSHNLTVSESDTYNIKAQHQALPMQGETDMRLA